MDYDTVNTDVLVPALEAYTSTLSAYYRAADAAQQAYIEEHMPEAEAAAAESQLKEMSDLDTLLRRYTV